MFDRFMEIDACVFLEGTAHVASSFSVNGPRCSGFPPVLVAVLSAHEGPYPSKFLQVISAAQCEHSRSGGGGGGDCGSSEKGNGSSSSSGAAAAAPSFDASRSATLMMLRTFWNCPFLHNNPIC